jgi:hypothetical protein
MTSPSSAPRPVKPSTALKRVAAMYIGIQALSYLVLQACCSPYASGDLWIHGALGPLAAVEAVPRFRYHSLAGNIGFVMVCVAVLVAPFAYVLRPRRLTLLASAVGLVVWCLFGMGFTVRHI